MTWVLQSFVTMIKWVKVYFCLLVEFTKRRWVPVWRAIVADWRAWAALICIPIDWRQRLAGGGGEHQPSLARVHDLHYPADRPAAVPALPGQHVSHSRGETRTADGNYSGFSTGFLWSNQVDLSEIAILSNIIHLTAGCAVQ